jgi:Cys-tRNA(Pro)/Cys-tRNA(Cys) deacylase
LAKKKIQKTNAIRLVEQKKIAYKEHEYAWSEDDLGAGHVSEQVAIAPARIFKTLVAVGNKTGPVVAVIPSDHELDLKKIAKASGNIRGGCSPIGMKKLFPTFVDASAENFEAIAISAGRRGLQMEIAPDAIVELTRGQFTELTH